MTTDRQALLDEIVERELDMFLCVPNQGGTADCQQRPKTFRLMRWMTHCVHDDQTLAAYADDLRQARQAGRNLLTEKYAGMEMQAEPDALRDSIAATETAFMLEASTRYPHAIQLDTSGESFHRYLRAELDTYSDTTIRLYANTIRQAIEENRNLAEARFDSLWKRLGSSLQAHESQLCQF